MITPKQLEQLKEASNEIIGDSIGTHQAVKQLKKTLDQILNLTHNQKLEEASSLGYNQLASDFIFLQRCLGGLHHTQNKIYSLTSQIAINNKSTFEEVYPEVENILKSFLNPVRTN